VPARLNRPPNLDPAGQGSRRLWWIEHGHNMGKAVAAIGRRQAINTVADTLVAYKPHTKSINYRWITRPILFASLRRSELSFHHSVVEGLGRWGRLFWRQYDGHNAGRRTDGSAKCRKI
jgi:hypothetical protein